MSQSELFEHSPLPLNQYGYPIEQAADRLARSSDPETSRSAAKKIACSVTQLAAAAAEIVRKYPGRTGAELDRLAGCEVKRTVSKRLADAADKFGLISRGPKRQCSIGGNEAITWLPLSTNQPIPTNETRNRCYHQKETQNVYYARHIHLALDRLFGALGIREGADEFAQPHGDRLSPASG
jgi:hypothetical protein